jgi:hypothetical protein
MSATPIDRDDRHVPAYPEQERPVARAKRTDRAEARRRYRASQGLTDAELDAAELDDTAQASSAGGASGTTARQGKPAAGASPALPQRIGIGQAFRLSFRPLDLRGDLAAFPRIAIRTKTLIVPLALTLVATALVIVVGANGEDLGSILTNFVYQYFVFTPAIGGVFIAGFLAPRASWMFGIVVGLVAAVCFSIVVLGFPGQVPPLTTTGEQAATSAFVVSPLMGALFASAAAWYRRFLALSSPNRARQAANANRPNGKSRAAGARR